MQIRFYIDPETHEPHIYGHGVTEDEVEQVMAGPGEDKRGGKETRYKTGRTSGGRYLRVVYAPDPEPSSVFVITAYPLTGKALKAHRRYMRGKRE